MGKHFQENPTADTDPQIKLGLNLIFNLVQEWTDKYHSLTVFEKKENKVYQQVIILSFNSQFSLPESSKPIPTAIVYVHWMMSDKQGNKNYLEYCFESDQLWHNSQATIRKPQMEVWLDKVLQDKLYVAEMMDLSTRFEQTRILPPIIEDEDAFYNCSLLESTVSEIDYDAELDEEFIVLRDSMIEESKKSFLPTGASFNSISFTILTFADAPKILKLSEDKVVKTQQTPEQQFQSYISWHPHLKEMETKYGAFNLTEQRNYYIEFENEKIERKPIDESFSRKRKEALQIYQSLADGSNQECMYKGEWNPKTKNRDGRGIIIWPNGSKFEGQFHENTISGWGRIFHVDGNMYEGEWCDDLAWGTGTFIYKNGTKYQGEWFKNFQHGKGVETYVDESKYTGEFFNGMKQGEGIFVWPNGNKYEGQWESNNMHGRGTFTWANGKQYVGFWENGLLCGQGCFTWPNGQKYEGEYLKNQKHGQGKFLWGDGRVYEGPWENGRQHGEGLYTNYEGAIKKGVWAAGDRKKWVREKKT